MEGLVDSVNTLTSTHTCFSDEVNTTATVDRDCTIDCEQGLNDKASLEKAISHMQRLLPSVTSHVAEQGRLSEWMSLFNLIDNDKFHVNHIASQLFFDVIKFATSGDARAMRYSPDAHASL